MTEAEWLTCGNPEAMAARAVGTPRATDRTCRLFVAAFWGWQAANLPADRQSALRERVEVTEYWAETGRMPKGKRRSRSRNVVFYNPDAGMAVRWTAVAPASWMPPAPVPTPAAVAVQTRLLRDVFGNPFRPVTADPAWLTPTAVQLARGIYDERAFDRLPILADALQDAGCDNEDVLMHCRGPGPHVRGCWVVDLMLGKA